MKNLKCKCKHKFQDKEYGEGIRAHNVAGPKEKRKYRCTVCGNEKLGAAE